MQIGYRKDRRTFKVAFISWHPAPYRDPLLERLNKSRDVELTVFNVLARDRGHGFWDLEEPAYSASSLGGNCRNRISKTFRLFKLFIAERYDLLILPVFMLKRFMLLSVVMHIFGRPFAILSDSDGFRRINTFFEWVRIYISRRAALLLVQGAAGKRLFVERYGVSDNRILPGVYALENGRLAREIADLRHRRDTLRRKFGLGLKDTVFVMVANMVPTRHYPITCAGFTEFAENNPGCVFLICGRGPLLDEMTLYAQEHKEIKVVPGCSFDAMKELYAMADVYVHGGKEPASTALVIGAISQLPIVSSYAVGCSVDLLVDNETGVVVKNHLSKSDWAAAFSEICRLRDRWAQMGRVASKKAEMYDADIVSKTVIEYMHANLGE